MSKGTEVLLIMATNDRLPSHPTEDGRATDSCFALIEAHPMADARYTYVEAASHPKLSI